MRTGIVKFFMTARKVGSSQSVLNFLMSRL